LGGYASSRRVEEGSRSLSEVSEALTGHLSESSLSRWVWVVPDIAALDRDFAYLVPPSLTEVATVGSIVRVSLHGRRVKGWIVAEGNDSAPPFALQPIVEVVGVGPPPSVVELSKWAAWRWAGRRRSLLKTASPPRNVKSIPRQSSSVVRTDQLHHPSPSRLEYVHAESSQGGGATEALPNLPDDWLARLPSAEVVAVDAVAAGRAVIRLAPGYHGFDLLTEIALSLRRAGKGRSKESHQQVDRGDAAEGCILVLAPSKERVARLVTYLRAAGFPVAELPDQWALAASGGRIVVGTRSAALAPCPRLDAVVVFDAESDTYKEERTPTVDARLIVAERAKRDEALMVMISPCPSMTVMKLGELITTSRTTERAGWPAVEVVDRSKDDPRLGLLSEQAVFYMRRTLREQLPSGVVPVVCVLNRKGKAKLLICARCGEVARCEECGGVLIQTSKETEVPTLTCPSCKTTRPQVCAGCGSSRLKTVKPGVSRVGEELEALLGVPVAQVTGESKWVPTAPVVVGTEAVFYRVPKAKLVILLDLDQEILHPKLRTISQSMAMLARAARTVGPRSRGGRLLLQTRSATHEVVKALLHADPWLAARAEISWLDEIGMPLSSPMAKITGMAAREFIESINEFRGKDGFPSVQTFPLGEEAFGVSAATIEEVCDALALVPRPSGRLRIDVEPVDL